MITGGWRGPGWRVVDADPRGAGEIRDWIRSAVAGHGCPVDPDDAALAAGELFVNALMHGPSRGKVLAGYCLWREGARIVVCDGAGPGAPQLRETGTGTEGGRGLHLVQELSARWGSFRLPGARAVRCDLEASRCAPRPVAARVPGSRLPRDTMNTGPDRPALPGPSRPAGQARCSASSVRRAARGEHPDLNQAWFPAVHPGQHRGAGQPAARCPGVRGRCHG